MYPYSGVFVPGQYYYGDVIAHITINEVVVKLLSSYSQYLHSKSANISLG